MSCEIKIKDQDQVEICSLDFEPLLADDDIEITFSDPTDSGGSGKSKFDEYIESNIEKLKEELQKQWEERRIGDQELSSGLAQGIVNIQSKGISDLLEIEKTKTEILVRSEELKLKQRQMKADLMLSILKAKEIESRIRLNEEQAKGFRDNSHIQATRMILNLFTTIYTQNQSINPPEFVQRQNLEDTVADLFNSLGMKNPLIDNRSNDNHENSNINDSD
jgi:hypothetical protein